MNKKLKYNQLCEIEPTIPIFSTAWWMDAVCGEENWDVFLVEKSGQIIASMPYYIKKDKWGLKKITMPNLLTQFNGIWIKYPEKQKYSSKLSYEKKIIYSIIEQLELLNIAAFMQRFHYSFTNWLPFFWKGFKQTTRYTYAIDDLNDLDLVFSYFDKSKRKNIKRAEKHLTVKYDLPAKDFYENHKITLRKQGAKIAYNFDVFKRIYDASYEHNSGKTIYCVDDKFNLHSAIFVVWDKNSAYDLISTIDPDFRQSGSSSLLIREIIKYVSCKTIKFDFEGSMIEDIERSFRRFGAIQKQYFSISKNYSPILMITDGLDEIAIGIKTLLEKLRSRIII